MNIVNICYLYPQRLRIFYMFLNSKLSLNIILVFGIQKTKYYYKKAILL